MSSHLSSHFDVFMAAHAAVSEKASAAIALSAVVSRGDDAVARSLLSGLNWRAENPLSDMEWLDISQELRKKPRNGRQFSPADFVSEALKNSAFRDWLARSALSREDGGFGAATDSAEGVRLLATALIPYKKEPGHEKIMAQMAKAVIRREAEAGAMDAMAEAGFDATDAQSIPVFQQMCLRAWANPRGVVSPDMFRDAQGEKSRRGAVLKNLLAAGWVSAADFPAEMLNCLTAPAGFRSAPMAVLSMSEELQQGLMSTAQWRLIEKKAQKRSEQNLMTAEWWKALKEVAQANAEASILRAVVLKSQNKKTAKDVATPKKTLLDTGVVPAANTATASPEQRPAFARGAKRI